MIVGFTGKLGSGKDTAAERLAALVTVPSERIAFADKLKNSAAAALGDRVTVDQFNEWKNNPDAKILVQVGTTGPAFLENEVVDVPNVVASVTIREYLQFYGTEAHREIFDDNFWVDAALPIRDLNGEAVDYTDALYVVTDVRFPNELQRVQDLGGIVIRVRGVNEETGTHASEQVLEGVDMEIDNSIRGDLYAWLDSQLQAVVYSYFGGAALKPTTSGIAA